MADPFARLRAASAAYNRTRALDDVTLDLPAGAVIAFCGPNGSGKSTALRLMRGLHPPLRGTVEIAGRALPEWTPRALARAVAMLSQTPEAPPELTVGELVMLGRFAHRRRFAGPSDADRAVCQRALAATGTEALRDRPIGQLSGGQMQRAWIAMTLAQDAPRIFLDEPTNHLDVAHAFEVLELISRLNRQEGRSFVLVLHDLNMAMRYADHVVLFCDGRIAAHGPTRQVLTEERVQQVFAIRCRIVQLAGEETPVLVPLPNASAGDDAGLASAAE